MHPSRLGVALYTHGCSNLDALATQVRERGAAAGAQIVAGPVAAGERRILLLRGPNEELFEFEQD
jgi:hypothetical protein